MRTFSGALPVAAVLVLAGCAPGAEDAPSALPRKTVSVPETVAYVSVAVDNHFHDVHMEEDVTVAADRDFVVKNQGRNLHNVTIPEIGFSRDIRPGDQIAFSPLGQRMPPGTYSIVCRYHASEGMTGEITVVR